MTLRGRWDSIKGYSICVMVPPEVEDKEIGEEKIPKTPQIW